ncbi:MAG: hypothetical protein HY763_16395 [Planctomycetes bacterium]|nr:hypothetical protein [Planctomycetota bacterium]
MQKNDVTGALRSTARDVACVHCGYNLRGLATEGLCPECGRAISLSLRGDLLRFSDPAWLERLRLGAWLLSLNIFLGFFMRVTGVPTVADSLRVASVLSSHASPFVGLLAALFVTAQEPRSSLQESGLSLRKVVRISAVIGVVGPLLAYADALTNLTYGLLAAVGGWLGLVGLVSAYLQLMYFRRLAMRIPDERLELSTKRFLWAAPIVLCLFAVPLLLLAIATPGGAPPPGGMAWPICIVSSAGFVICVWSLLLVARYFRAMAVASLQARANLTRVDGTAGET